MADTVAAAPPVAERLTLLLTVPEVAEILRTSAKVIREEVRAALSDALKTRARAKAKALLGKVEAAQRLGVSRATLEAMIRDRSLQVVHWRNGHIRIPASEIDRLATEGITSTRRVRLQKPVSPPPPGVGDRIRALKV